MERCWTRVAANQSSSLMTTVAIVIVVSLARSLEIRMKLCLVISEAFPLARRLKHLLNLLQDCIPFNAGNQRVGFRSHDG